MWNVRVYDAPDDESHYERTCKACLAQEFGITEHQATVKIKEQSGPVVHARKRAVSFKTVFTETKKDPALQGMSNNVIRTIMRKDLTQLFAPLAEFITRKLKKMVQRNKGVEEYDKLLEQFRKEPDTEKQFELIEQLEKMEDLIDEANKNMAFKSFEDQQQCINVAQYHDEWTISESVDDQ